MSQSHQGWEHILVSDGGPAGIFDELPADTRRKEVRIDHVGRALALKHALSLAKGRMIAFLDADDILHPDALEVGSAALYECLNLGFIYTRRMLIDAEGHPIRIDGQRAVHNIEPCLAGQFRLMRRTALDQAGGIDTSFKYAMDYDLCLRASEKWDVGFLHQPLMKKRLHKNSISMAHAREQDKFALLALNNALRRRGGDYIARVENGKTVICPVEVQHG